MSFLTCRDIYEFDTGNESPSFWRQDELQRVNVEKKGHDLASFITDTLSPLQTHSRSELSVFSDDGKSTIFSQRSQSRHSVDVDSFGLRYVNIFNSRMYSIMYLTM